MAVFLRWWIILLLTIVGCMIIGFTGGFTKVYDDDPSMISFLIMVIGAYISIKVGYLTWLFCKINSSINLTREEKQSTISKIIDIDINKEGGWFASTLCSKVGLLGTMLGFILALAALSTLDLSNPVSLKDTVLDMSVGIKIALYTTLVGQICNIIIGAQVFNLSQAIQYRLNIHEDSTTNKG